jgi:hypothetical protein
MKGVCKKKEYPRGEGEMERVPGMKGQRTSGCIEEERGAN